MPKFILSRFKNLSYKDFWPYFLLVAVVSLLFLPILLKWQGIFHNDHVEEFTRYYFTAFNFQRGIIPLWDPLTWCGALPFYGKFLGDIYYVVLWPIYLFANLKDINDSYWVLILIPLWLHYILGAFGMFVFLRRNIECTLFSSFIGACAYVFSPNFMYAHVWQQVVTALSWLPWFIIIYLSAVRKLQFWKILTGGIILSFIITSGQITYWHFVVFLWLAIAMFPLVGQSYSDKKKIIGKSFCIVAAIVVIGIGLSGIYISSLLDVKQYTDLYVKLDANAALNRQAFNLHPLYLITLFIPDFFGNITGKNMANLIPDNLVNFWESNMSGGIAVSLIIFFCLVMIFFCPNLQKRQRWIALIMGGVYLFAILCVLGQYTPFYEHIISQIPIIRIFPYPVRYRMLQCFAVAILMPLGIDYLMRDNGLSQKKRYLKCGVLIYTIFMFSVIATVLAWSDKKVHQEWYP